MGPEIARRGGLRKNAYVEISRCLNGCASAEMIRPFGERYVTRKSQPHRIHMHES
jgi:hypothetical protein